MKDLFSIEGKIALVTGGSRGIGEMIAAGFLSSGVKVYISSRKVEACDSAAQKLSQEFGGECISIPADLSNLQWETWKILLGWQFFFVQEQVPTLWVKQSHAMVELLQAHEFAPKYRNSF